MITADNNPIYGASIELIQRATNTTLTTATRWKKNPDTIPPAPLRLIQFYIDGDLSKLAGKDWKDFTIKNGKIFIPFFRAGFTPAQIAAMFFEKQELYQTRIDFKILQEENTLLKSNAEKYRAIITGTQRKTPHE